MTNPSTPFSHFMTTHQDLTIPSHIQEPKLLMLICCAPCACAAVEAIANAKLDATLLFYNPNIQPPEEYEIRRDEVQRLAQHFNLKFAEGPYHPEAWEEINKDLSHLPERDLRCENCFQLRLNFTVDFALKHDFNMVGSVLGFSRWKSTAMASQTLQKAVAPFTEKITAWDINWRKCGRQERNAQLMRELQFYNQTYCGCLPSIRR